MQRLWRCQKKRVIPMTRFFIFLFILLHLSSLGAPWGGCASF